MAKDSSLSQVATNALQSLPLGNLIGAPLTACAEAQADQAKVAAKFMKEVGLDPDKDAKDKE
ncbi:DUF2589 domain-containing protein [uncultured Parabacteroides sp.]|uniref:DUF2589 domain-containing protein n=1 Tax=uncultured Parabacteroides sp. TaxID=512312 RepID=UPI0025D113AC|nr:DUF2589 domain-containing protein [uncultured Parabacteroides sp.]MCD7851244.1 DUF2589 domain-containing protein [Parabacteroides sp.]